MTKRDYTKEIDLDSGERVIPLPYVLLMLGALMIAGRLGVVAQLAHTKLGHSGQVMASTPARAVVFKHRRMSALGGAGV